MLLFCSIVLWGGCLLIFLLWWPFYFPCESRFRFLYTRNICVVLKLFLLHWCFGLSFKLFVLSSSLVFIFFLFFFIWLRGVVDIRYLSSLYASYRSVVKGLVGVLLYNWRIFRQITICHLVLPSTYTEMVQFSVLLLILN